jgi:hypothetical protein
LRLVHSHDLDVTLNVAGSGVVVNGGVEVQAVGASQKKWRDTLARLDKDSSGIVWE